MKAKKRDRGKANLDTIVGGFLVIETQKNNVASMDFGNADIKGPFKTQRDAEAYLRRDAAESYDNLGEAMRAGEDTEWGSDVAICEIKRVCRPVPVVCISATIMDIPNTMPQPRR